MVTTFILLIVLAGNVQTITVSTADQCVSSAQVLRTQANTEANTQYFCVAPDGKWIKVTE